MSSSDSSDSSFFSSFFSSAERTKAVVSEAPCSQAPRGPRACAARAARPALTCSRGRTSSRSCSSWGSGDGYSPTGRDTGQLANPYRNQRRKVRREQLHCLPDVLGLSPSASVTGSRVPRQEALPHYLPQASHMAGTKLAVPVSRYSCSSTAVSSGCLLSWLCL